MKASIELKTQGTTGKDWKPFQNQGAVLLRINYDGTNGHGTPIFTGTMDELINKLKK